MVQGAPLPQRHQRKQHVPGHVCLLLHHGVEPVPQHGLRDVRPPQDRRVVVAGLPLPDGRVAPDDGPVRRRGCRPHALVRRHPRPRRVIVLVPPDRQSQHPRAPLHPCARRTAPRRHVVVDGGRDDPEATHLHRPGRLHAPGCADAVDGHGLLHLRCAAGTREALPVPPAHGFRHPLHFGQGHDAGAGGNEPLQPGPLKLRHHGRDDLRIGGVRGQCTLVHPDPC
mmetsp:Transcript_3404/g.10067  ORF Transcript_3404/g.10067 Transcript_3404/m.10067 type:complete len:225 (+) Transcript_3404:810-1484(+)